jgi:aspartate carbamoyltransferase catalytic subunit
MKPDCLVMRHTASGAADYVARHLDIPVVNAGDGTHEHPSQGLLDALTIRDRLGKIENLNVTILGDILHSRVARSNIHLLGKFGCRFTLCGPSIWVPRELEKIAPGVPIRCVYNVEEALEDAHVIIMLRVQTERLSDPPLSANDYILLYQLNAQRLERAHRDAIVLHPGPIGSGRRGAVVRARTGDQRRGRAHGHPVSGDRRRLGGRRAPGARGEDLAL